MTSLSVAIKKNNVLQKLSLIKCKINDESLIPLTIGL